ncbi:ATP-binding protein [Micromonospora sp. NPDC003197]
MADKEPLAPDTVPSLGLPVLVAEAFDGAEVTGLRHAVASYAEESGLAGQRLDDFVLAVNELITNAVRHGGGRGWLRLWREDSTVRCEVTDSGEGIDTDQLGQRTRPAPDTAGGRGLWLARQLSDDMVVSTGARGTTVRISTAVAPADQQRADWPTPYSDLS